MLYMVIEKYKDRNAEAVYNRFREKGRMLPEGLKYISSWVQPDFERCFQLMECDNPALFDRWTIHWQDLVDFEIEEVISSADAAASATSKS